MKKQDLLKSSIRIPFVALAFFLTSASLLIAQQKNQ